MLRRLNLGILISALVILSSVMVSQAGPVVWNLDLVSASCESITVNYDSNDSIFVTIQASHGTGSVVTPDPIFSNISDDSVRSATFDFTPALPDGTTVTIEARFERPFTNNNDQGYFSGIDALGSRPDSIEGSSVTTIREVVVTVNCEEVVIVEDLPFIGCNDGRLNQLGCEPIAIYLVNTDDGFGMNIWSIDSESSIGIPTVYVAAEDLDTALALGGSTCTIAVSSDGTTGVYILADGTLQVIHGPDVEDKYFVFTFENGYPSSPTPTTYTGGGLPQVTDC